MSGKNKKNRLYGIGQRRGRFLLALLVVISSMFFTACGNQKNVDTIAVADEAVNGNKDDAINRKYSISFEGEIDPPYTLENIEEKMISENRANIGTGEFELAGQLCTNIWYGGSRYTTEDRTQYYIFADEEAAQIAFQDMEMSKIDQITDQGEGYIQGWVDCEDASVEKLIFIDHNVVVETDLQIESAWSPEFE